MTADEMAECAAGGQFWYMRPDGSFYGVGVDAVNPGPADPDDHYLLNATPEWIAQWDNWDDAVAALSPLFAALDEYRT